MFYQKILKNVVGSRYLQPIGRPVKQGKHYNNRKKNLFATNLELVKKSSI